MPGGCEGGGEVREVWGAYHERERLCPEGVRVVEIAHVHYDRWVLLLKHVCRCSGGSMCLGFKQFQVCTVGASIRETQVKQS
jgi:hypothetical protein